MVSLGITNVHVIFDMGEQIFNYDTFNDAYGFHPPFTTFKGLKAAIQNRWSSYSKKQLTAEFYFFAKVYVYNIE